MGKLHVPGVGTFTVPNSFAQQSPEDQQKAIADLVAQVKGGQGQPQQPSEAQQAQQAQTTPSEDPSEQPSLGSLGNAALQSVIHGLPAAVEGGVASLGRTAAPGWASTWDALQKQAGENRAAQAKNYQRPASVDHSPVHALTSGHPMQALTSALYSGAENLGPIAADLGVAAIPYVGLPAALGMGALEGADSVNEARRASGLKADQALTKADLANVAGQAAINAVPGGEGLHAAIAPFARGALDSLLNAASVSGQGGNVGSAGDVARNAADAALQYGTVGALSGVPRATDAIKQTGERYLTPYGRAIGELSAAQRSGDRSGLSKQARTAQGNLDYLNALQGRRDSEDGYVGSVPGDVSAKSDMKSSVAQIERIIENLKDAGPDYGGYSVAPKALKKSLTNALTEARQHNQETAETTKGTDAAPSFTETVRSLGLDPDVEQAIIARLQTINREAYDGKKKNTRGVFAPAFAAAAATVPSIGGGLLGMAHGGEMEALGGLLGAPVALAKTGASRILIGGARKAGTALDRKLGIGIPYGQRGMAAKLALAERYGVKPSVTSDMLAEIEDNSAQAANDFQEAKLAAQRQRASRTRQSPSQRPRSPQQPDGGLPVNNGSLPSSFRRSDGPYRPEPEPPQGPSVPPGPVAPQGPSVPPGPVAPQAPQAPKGPIAPTGQTASPERPAPRKSHAHTVADLSGMPDPGWSGHIQTSLGVGPMAIKSYLSNQVADGKLSMADFRKLMQTDNIGADINKLKNRIDTLKQVGAWGRESAIRDPDAATVSSEALGLSLGGSTKEAKGGKETPKSHIRNPISYAANVRSAQRLADSIAQAHPDLAESAHTIQNSGDERSKTQEGRVDVMEEQLERIKDPVRRAQARKILTDLTVYGKKGTK